MKSKEIIKNYCSNNPKMIIKLVCLMLASVTLLVAYPLLMKFIIEMFERIVTNNAVIKAYGNDPLFASKVSELIDANHSHIITSVILIVSFGLSMALSFYVNIMFENVLSKFGSEITETLRGSAYSSLLRGEYYEIATMEIGEINEIIVESTDKIGSKYIANHLLKIIYYASKFVASLIVLFCFNVTAGFIVLITVPVIYVTTLYIGKFILKQNEKYNKLLEERDQEISYNINNLKEIKIRNGIEKEEKDYIEISKKIKKNSDNRFTLKAISEKHLNTLIRDLVMVGVLSIFVVEASSDPSFDISLAMGAILISPIAYNQFKDLVNCYFDKQYVTEAYKKVDNILNLRPESRNETLSSLSDEVHTLAFNNVSFEYNLTQSGVEKITFELKKGEKLGILGYQKSGKTTVVDLITKVIRPRYGNVLINNCDINKLSTSFLRDTIAYVPQDFKLFDGTIEENITYPMPIDEYKYNEALNKCKLKVLLMNLPKRDQEKVNNIKLSPADIERIGLANAFYKDSPIIILDEATCKLDQATEQEILNEFFKLKNKMMIIASNRISTIMKCDKVLILNEGKVVEFGRTEDLMADKRSTYSKMVEK